MTPLLRHINHIIEAPTLPSTEIVDVEVTVTRAVSTDGTITTEPLEDRGTEPFLIGDSPYDFKKLQDAEATITLYVPNFGQHQNYAYSSEKVTEFARLESEEDLYAKGVHDYEIVTSQEMDGQQEVAVSYKAYLTCESPNDTESEDISADGSITTTHISNSVDSETGIVYFRFPAAEIDKFSHGDKLDFMVYRADHNQAFPARRAFRIIDNKIPHEIEQED